MNSSKLLINEPALQVLPSLATLIGLNEAIALQQLHYWLVQAERTRKLGICHAGRWWVFNNMKAWQVDNFPFWSVKTCQRTFDNLRERGLVVVDRLGDKNTDQTLYYTIDYQKLDRLFDAQQYAREEPQQPEPEQEPQQEDALSPFGQNDQMGAPFGQNDQMGAPFGQNDQMGAPFGQNDQIHLPNLTKSIWPNCPNVNKESETSSKTTQRDGGGPPIQAEDVMTDAWKAARHQLKLEMRLGDYEHWVGPLKLCGYADGVVHLAAPDEIHAGWVQGRLGKRLERLLSPVLGGPVQVEVVAYAAPSTV